jgi:hypothetical protein
MTWVQLALCNSAVLDVVAFAAIMSLIDFYLEPVEEFPAYVQGVARGVLFGSISRPVPAVELAKALEHAYTGVQAAQVRQSLDRAIAVGLRVGLNGTDGPEDGDLYWYFGPEDERNRKSFCKHMVDKCYTAAMIGKCANGFLNDVWINCGGPYCRHVWIKVTRAMLADKKSNGYGIDLTDRIVVGYTVGTSVMPGEDGRVSSFIVPSPPLEFVHIHAPDEGPKHGPEAGQPD